jgi:hypothetical protein
MLCSKEQQGKSMTMSLSQKMTSRQPWSAWLDDVLM